MKTVNGYEVGNEPTSEDFIAYWRVQDFLRREWIAGELGEGELTADEFDTLVGRYAKLDFSAEECDALDYEVERILDERPGTPYDGPDGEARYREEFGFEEAYPYVLADWMNGLAERKQPPRVGAVAVREVDNAPEGALAM